MGDKICFQKNLQFLFSRTKKTGKKNCLSEELKDEKIALMPIMQKALGSMGICRLRSENHLRSDRNPVKKIYGVATFYAQFNLSPKESLSDICLSWRHAM